MPVRKKEPVRVPGKEGVIIKKRHLKTPLWNLSSPSTVEVCTTYSRAHVGFSVCAALNCVPSLKLAIVTTKAPSGGRRFTS